MKNYYAILEVPVGCAVPEVRESYRRLVQENLWNRDVFAELKEAYEVLTTPARRADYDRAQFGQTFSDTPAASAESNGDPPRPSRACPMGAASQCPVINARVPLSDVFCPECGVTLSAMPDPVQFPDFAAGAAHTGARLENAQGERFPLHPGANIVGREGADILLPDKTVSRRHAQIVLAADGKSATLEDFGSTNGTRLADGGDALPPDTPTPLEDGGRVLFGSVELILVLPEAAAAPGARAQFVVTRGADAAKAHPLAPGVTTFGRRAENSVVLGGDPYISGIHAQVIAEGDEFRISDLGSTNGTRVNGEELPAHQPRPLREGDEVVFGGTVYRFERFASAKSTAGPQNVVQDNKTDNKTE